MTLLEAIYVCKDKHHIEWNFYGKVVTITRIDNKHYTPKERKAARARILELAKEIEGGK